MMIRWDFWQYLNTILHSLTGHIAIASQHSLHHRISEEKAKGTDEITKSNSYLFSVYYHHQALFRKYPIQDPLVGDGTFGTS